MGMKNSYFAIPNLLVMLDRWRNPESCHSTLLFRGEPLTVSWTRRAGRQLARREQPLLAEMQLYFSCVVKKRVVFHELAADQELQWLPVNAQLQVAFRPVEANSCDPREFAASFPVRRELDSRAAGQMHPAQLHLDFRAGQWCGEFSL
jgi:hypothetical protein